MVLKGLSAEETDSWNYDDVADRIAQYADPYILYDLYNVAYEGRNFVVLHVHEFDDIPVICKKDLLPALQKGGCYVRGRGKPQTTHIPSQTEMRELLEISVSKRIQQYIRVLRLSDPSHVGA